MTLFNNIAEPKYNFEEIVDDGLLIGNTFFLGCVSYEDRCKTVANAIIIKNKIPMHFIQIEDDECTFLPWKTKCNDNTVTNWNDLRSSAAKADIKLADTPLKYKMSNRAEDILKLRNDIKSIINKVKSNDAKLRFILDLSCIPSYFSFQLLKYFINDIKIDDFVILYTKPQNYAPEEEGLKTSPPDSTTPVFLPSFGNRKEKIYKCHWIVGVGFDYDSVKNAERIKEVIYIEKINIIIPFPGYEPEYVTRTMKENQHLLEDKNDFWYAPADNPFRTFRVIDELVTSDRKYILSAFGPKPMALGFCMAAIKFNLPLLHVQATNYNPNFSTGYSNTFVYWIKYKGKIWWDSIYG